MCEIRRSEKSEKSYDGENYVSGGDGDKGGKEAGGDKRIKER